MAVANGDPTRIDKFNQLVRSGITIAFVLGFVYQAIVAKTVTQETYNQLVVLVVTWWFVRDAAHAAVRESVSLLKEPPPNSMITQSTVTPQKIETVTRPTKSEVDNP